MEGMDATPLRVIRHLGYVQIDTISVVERAHHHVFWVRNNEYQPIELDRLVEKRKVFEYWSHAASYLPMQDYKYSLIRKSEFASRTSAWFPRDAKMMREILKRIEIDGPLKSSDFKQDSGRKGSGWWDWKPAKKALERLFLEGQLEVSKREGFHKVYDLPERVLPVSTDLSTPTQQEYLRYLIRRTLGSHGIASATEIGYLQKKKIKDQIQTELEEMVLAGEVVKIKVTDLMDDYFCYPKTLNVKPRIGSKIKIISPFDNFSIQRSKLQNLFNFDYQIECYVPEQKRKFGYFCLPIFKGAQALGRVDCKAHRKEKEFEIKSLHYEKGVDQKSIAKPLLRELTRFSRFNGGALSEESKKLISRE
tara:strand:+ start:22860 stop:23948 length:1089 start_codon:yes stop_codon:yes gene_type:complete